MIAKHREEILKRIHGLKSHGFKVISGDPDTEDRLILENQHIRISIDYLVFVNTSAFSVFVTRRGHNSNFTFNEYLDYINTPRLAKKAQESDAEFIKRYLDSFIQKLNSSLNEVVTGKKWIDVPRDYMGYK